MNSIINNNENTENNDVIYFMNMVIGSYAKFRITKGKIYETFYINKYLLKNFGLTDNSRCYTKKSEPNIEKEYGMFKLMKNYVEIHFNKIKDLEDVTFYIAFGDFPIIHKNKNLHPHTDRYKGEIYDVYPKKLPKIFSRSIDPKNHEDLLFPTRDYIDVIYNIDEIKSKINYDFNKKKSKAIFRGSFTGNNRTFENIRIQSKLLSIQYPEFLDVKIFHDFDYYMYEFENSCVFTEIQSEELIQNTNIKNEYISIEEQAFFNKYILHIDGFVSAWRLSREMLLISTILKVDSVWFEHYYDQLIPWKHYIPIKSDLSDLIQIIIWCNKHNDICHEIALNAYRFAIDNFNEQSTFEYLDEKIYDIPRNIKNTNSSNNEFSYENLYYSEIDELNKIIENIDNTPQIDLSKIKIKKKLLPLIN